MARKKNEEKEIKEEAEEVLEEVLESSDIPIKTEKEKLLELYQTFKDLGINSISDLEVKISRL